MTDTYSETRGQYEAMVLSGVETTTDTVTPLPITNGYLAVVMTGHTYPVSLTIVANANCVDQTMITIPEACIVVGAYYTHATAGNDASAVTLDLTKDTGTNAPGAGSTLLQSTFNCKGTANTVQTGSLVSSSTTRSLAAGDRIGLNFTGTVTTLAGVNVTVLLRKL